MCTTTNSKQIHLLYNIETCLIQMKLYKLYNGGQQQSKCGLSKGPDTARVTSYMPWHRPPT